MALRPLSCRQLDVCLPYLDLNDHLLDDLVGGPQGDDATAFEEIENWSSPLFNKEQWKR